MRTRTRSAMLGGLAVAMAAMGGMAMGGGGVNVRPTARPQRPFTGWKFDVNEPGKHPAQRKSGNDRRRSRAKFMASGRAGHRAACNR